MKPYYWLNFGNNLISRDQCLIHPKTRPDMDHRASQTPRAILTAAGTVNIAGPRHFSGEGLASGSEAHRPQSLSPYVVESGFR